MRTRSPVVAATKHGCSPSNSPIEIRPGSSFWLRFSVKIGTNIVSPIDLTFFLKISVWWRCTYILFVKELLQRYGESKFTWAVYESPLKFLCTFLSFRSRYWKLNKTVVETLWSNIITFTTNSCHLLLKTY